MQTPDFLPYSRRNRPIFRIISLIAIGLSVVVLVVYQVPRVKRLVDYRLDMALTYMEKVINPVSDLPTPAVSNAPEMPLPAVSVTLEAEPSATSQPSPTPEFTPTPTLVPTPIPNRLQLDPPAYDAVRDKQDLNNCGPATLALHLRFFGWKGNQYEISNVIKPSDDDRNVNIEELVYYVRNKTGWLNAEYRVGGDLDTLKRIIGAGVPVMIETTFEADRDGWPNDDRWAGHYLLVTGYDDATEIFTVHDTEKGPNQQMPYQQLADDWQSFNYVYLMVYVPEQKDDLKRAIGENWDVEINRQNALALAQAQAEADPDNPFTWFNIGTNLVYFERYHEAAEAYDTARSIGLPQRMLRYQFGPLITYFWTQRTDDLIALTDHALKQVSRTSEEAMLWRGWAEFRLGNKDTALGYFRAALKMRPDYEDALWAIDFVNTN
jgi:tetratricopeptide (TPR) repeat protein